MTRELFAWPRLTRGEQVYLQSIALRLLDAVPGTVGSSQDAHGTGDETGTFAEHDQSSRRIRQLDRPPADAPPSPRQAYEQARIEGDDRMFLTWLADEGEAQGFNVPAIAATIRRRFGRVRFQCLECSADASGAAMLEHQAFACPNGHRELRVRGYHRAMQGTKARAPRVGEVSENSTVWTQDSRSRRPTPGPVRSAAQSESGGWSAAQSSGELEPFVLDSLRALAVDDVGGGSRNVNPVKTRAGAAGMLDPRTTTATRRAPKLPHPSDQAEPPRDSDHAPDHPAKA